MDSMTLMLFHGNAPPLHTMNRITKHESVFFIISASESLVLHLRQRASEKAEPERNSLRRIDDSFKKMIIVKDAIVPL